MKAAGTRTSHDTVLVDLFFLGLVGGSLMRLLDGPGLVSALLTLLAAVAGVWVAWRWYARQPDGRRGE